MNALRRWWHGFVLDHIQVGSSRFTGAVIDDPRSDHIYLIVEDGWDCECGRWFPL